MTKESMTYHSEKWNYYGITSDGHRICVDSQEMAESATDRGLTDNEITELSATSRSQQWIDEAPETWAELLDPDVWQTCIGANQNVYYVNEDLHEVDENGKEID